MGINSLEKRVFQKPDSGGHNDVPDDRTASTTENKKAPEFAPPGWMRRTEMISVLRGTIEEERERPINPSVVGSLIHDYLVAHPGRSDLQGEFNFLVKSTKGKDVLRPEKRSFFPPEVFNYVRQNIDKARAPLLSPEGWRALSPVIKELRDYSLDHTTGQKYLDAFIAGKVKAGEVHVLERRPRGGRGRASPVYSPEAIAYLKSEAIRTAAPVDWYTAGRLATELNEALGISIGHKVIKKYLKEYTKTHADVEHERTYRAVGPGETPHYSPDAVAHVRAKVERETPRDGWLTANAVAKELHAAVVTVRPFFEEFTQAHPDHQHLARSSAGEQTPFYSPEAVQYVRQKFLESHKAPADWMSSSALAVELEDDYQRTRDLLEEFVVAHPDQEHKYVQESARPDAEQWSYYSPEAVAYATKLSMERRAPQGWYTAGRLAHELRVGQQTVQNHIDAFLESNGPGEFRKEYSAPGRTLTWFYSPEVVAYVRKTVAENKANEPVEDLPAAPDGWMTVGGAARSLKVASSTAEAYLKEFVQKHGGEHQKRCRMRFVRYGQMQDGRPARHYSPEAIAYAKEKIEKVPMAEGQWKDWVTNKELAHELNVGQDATQIRLDTFVSGHGQEHKKDLKVNKVRRGKIVAGEIAAHFSPEAAGHVTKEISEIQTLPPTGWFTKYQAAPEIGVSPPTAGIYLEEFVSNNNPDHKAEFMVEFESKSGQKKMLRPEWHYSPEAIAYAKQRSQVLLNTPKAEEGWSAVSAIAENFGDSNDRLTKIIIERYFAENPDAPPPQMMRRRAVRKKTGLAVYGFPVLHYPPEVVEYTAARLREHKSERLAVANTVTVEEFLKEGEGLEKYKQLVTLFGSAQSVDLLYAMHPQFAGIPVEQVREGLAEYLGNYLLTPAPFSLTNVKGAEVYLKNKNFREGLREVIKGDCLHQVLLKKKGAPGVDEQGLFNEYIADLKSRAAALKSPELDETIVEVENYYRAVETLEKPKHIVDSLKSGRAFPDIYQKINIREISDKKRLLIADEMGVGKSASAILAKETLGIRTALVLVPSNTTETWQSYLSDKVEEGGKQVGYFKRGEAPRVFTVEGPEDLAALKDGSYDYVVVSHEKLNEYYMDGLKELDFGMLVVDEVHKLKNVSEGKRASNLIELSQKIDGDGKYLAMLSGTPVPNKVEDVAMILKLLHPERFRETENKALVSSIIKGDVLDLRALLVPYMQMKSLGEHIEMPELRESVIEVTLSPEEQDVYQILLEEDELTPTQKIQELRQFLMNHALNDITPGVPNSKVEAAHRELSAAFAEKDKVAMYVNDYITDVIRGNDSILPQLGLPPGVDVRVVHGGNRESRSAVQAEFNTSPGKMLLAISGDTADVGVDYSGGQGILFYNEPWNKAKKDQQEARVFRPGVSGDIESKTLITKGTIEEGMHRYIEAKQRAIEKLLRVVPLTESEREMLEKVEDVGEEDLGVNTEFAKYYFSSFDQMNRIFAAVKEMGEKDFTQFLERYGALYAECYQELGSRSYQGNASRVCATVIQNMAREQGKVNPRILDIASGPEMLRRHSSENTQGNIVSMDLNSEHFAGTEDRGQVVVGSFTKLPVGDDSMDYVNLSLALHYSKFVPSRGEYERAHVLAETSRVLKDGGRAVINMIYSLDFKDLKKLGEVAELFGLKVINEYSGEASAGGNYQSRIVTFEKVKGIGQTVDEIMPNLLKEDMEGLKLRRTDTGLKDSRRIISRFTMGGKEFTIEFNERDRKLLDAENKVLTEGEAVKKEYGSIEAIPRDEVIAHNFVRLRAGKKYILFKKIPEGGAVVIK